MSQALRFKCVGRLLWRQGFQSTRPHGARPGAPARRHRPPYRFNPRARTGRDLSAGLIGLLLAWLVLARLLVLGVVLLLLSRVLLVRVLLLRVVLLLLLVVLLSHGYLLHMVVKEARQTKRPTAAQICTALVTSVGPDMRLSRRTGQSVRSPMLRHRR